MRLLGHKAFLLVRGEEIKRNQDVYFARTYSWLLGVLLWKICHFAFPFGLLGPLAAVGLVLAWRHRPPSGFAAALHRRVQRLASTLFEED